MSFSEFLWGMVIFFLWIMYIWMFIAIFGDIFRRDDINGWGKGGWIFLIFVIPFFGILLYLIVRPKMTAQDQAMMQAAQVAQRQATGYSAADEVAKAKGLLDSGAITAEEFEALKKQAMLV